MVHVKVLIGLILALACAVGASLSGLWKQRGAVQCEEVDVRRPVQSALALFRSKWFAIGWVVAVVAWLLHIGALALAPISLAQAVIAGGLVLLGLLAERFFGFELSRRQWLGLAVLAVGMTVLAVTAHSENNHATYGALPLIVFETIAVVLGAAVVGGCRLGRMRSREGVLLGFASGIWFGVADVSIKAITSGTHGVVGVIGPWTLLGTAAALAAFYASARSLQIGDAVAVIAATASAANVLGILGGVVVFGDPIGSHAATVVGRVFAFALVVLAAALMPAPVRAHEHVREEQAREDAPSAEEERKKTADLHADPSRAQPDAVTSGERSVAVRS